MAPQGVVHGKENHWLFEAAGAGGFRKPVAADRARAWSARSQHHGILQVLQRTDQKLEKGAPIPVVITVYADRSFTFEMKTPPVSYFLKKAAKLESGAKAPGRDKVGKVTKAQVKEIAEQKMKDLNCSTIDAAMRMIEGSARSMGIEVGE